MSPDALHSIKDQFCIKSMINHISFTSIPPIPISDTQQHLPILLLPLFPKLWILATVFPLFSFYLRFKKNQGLFYIIACLIYISLISQYSLAPLWIYLKTDSFSSLQHQYYIALSTRSHQRWAQMHFTASRIDSASNLWLITSVSHLFQPSPFLVLNNTCLICFFHYFQSSRS